MLTTRIGGRGLSMIGLRVYAKIWDLLQHGVNFVGALDMH